MLADPRHVEAIDAYAEGLQFKAIKVYDRGVRNDAVWQIVRDGVQPVEGGHASATDGTKLHPSVVIDNSDTLHRLREAMLGEWLALETQTDVINVDIADPAAARDHAKTFSLAEPA